MSKISIIIPVCNADAYLDECLTSVTQQTYADLEVIVINDGSTDNSLSIARRHAASDHRMRVVSHRTNQGVSVARNKGLNEATGDYITFIDADDYLMDKTAFATLMKSADPTADLICFSATIENKSSSYMKNIGRYASPDQLRDFCRDTIISEQLNAVWSKLYRTSLIRKHNIDFDTNLRVGEDLLFNVKYLTHCASVQCIDLPVYYYRTSNLSSITQVYKSHHYATLMQINDEVHELVTASFNSPATIDAVRYIRMKNVLSCIRRLSQSNMSPSNGRALARSYKQPNRYIIVHRLGAKILFISIAYSMLSGTTIYGIFGLLGRKK